MPFGGLIVNRVHPLRGAGLEPDAVLAELREPLGEALAAKVARTWAEELVLPTATPRLSSTWPSARASTGRS